MSFRTRTIPIGLLASLHHVQRVLERTLATKKIRSQSDKNFLKNSKNLKKSKTKKVQNFRKSRFQIFQNFKISKILESPFWEFYDFHFFKILRFLGFSKFSKFWKFRKYEIDIFENFDFVRFYFFRFFGKFSRTFSRIDFWFFFVVKVRSRTCCTWCSEAGNSIGIVLVRKDINRQAFI